MADGTGLDPSRYRIVQAVATAMLLITFAVGASIQANLLYLVGDPVPATAADAPTVPRLAGNIAACVVVLACLLPVPFPRLRWPIKLLAITAAMVTGSFARDAVLVATGVHPLDQPRDILLDMIAPAVTSILSLLFGLILAETDKRLRQQQHASIRQGLRAARALRDLESEELRVRRDVAEGLHGTMQQRLIVISAELQGRRRRMSPGSVVTPDDDDHMKRLVTELDAIREQDVRQFSQFLYPAGVETGLSTAIRILLRRVNEQIAVDLDIDPALTALEHNAGIPLPLRLLVVRILEEGIANALRHGDAGRLSATVRLDDDVIALTLDDDGRGVNTASNYRESGLTRLRERVREHGGNLTLAPSALGGGQLRASVPVPRG